MSRGPLLEEQQKDPLSAALDGKLFETANVVHEEVPVVGVVIWGGWGDEQD